MAELKEKYTSSRSKSPEDKCFTPNFLAICSHCVPLPEAGGPATIIRNFSPLDVAITK